MPKIEWKISQEPVQYEDAVRIMEQRVADIAKSSASELVWLVEHPPLYTAGTSAKEADLLDHGRFTIYTTGRGGEYTYHGPGQRIAYVMLNLKARNAMDIKAYVRNLEQWLINSLQAMHIKGETHDGRVGIWVKTSNAAEAKIAAIGIRVRKWVTYHGIAININPDLSHFSGIVPCGISEHGVTSLESLGIKTTISDVDTILKNEFSKIFKPTI